MKQHFDTGSISVILITLLLFAVALAVKGFTHDLLLEAGVFLVSVKLVLMSYKNSVATKAIDAKLAEIASAVRKIGEKHTDPTGK